MGQQGDSRETTPEVPLQSLEAEKTWKWGGEKAALPSTGSGRGQGWISGHCDHGKVLWSPCVAAYRIMYRLELEDTLKIIQFKPPAMGRDAIH